MVWLRRSVQAACLALFFYLFWLARFEDNASPNRWLRLFFELDPLVALATSIAARAVIAGALVSLITVVATLLFGRVFCGWVCPLGTIQHAASWLGQVMRRGRPKAQDYAPAQKAKYYLLVGLLVMAALGAHWIGVFDPISLLYRLTATVLYPGVQYAIEEGATAVYQGDPHVGSLHLTSVTEPVYGFTSDHLFMTDQQAFWGSTFIGILSAVILLLNLYRRRFWCRYVCPLGALLGTLARRQVLRLTNDPDACKQCGRCATVCPAGATPETPNQWRAAECFGCWNCVPSCKFNALTFKFGLPWRAPSEARVDLGKRATLAASAGGVAGVLLFRGSPQTHGRVYNPALIRPPGSRDEREFLKRCLQCGACMKACPTNGLQPTLFEAGLEGLWTPRLVPHVGCCEYECNLCGQVCPTEAIEPLTMKEKKETKIGLASFDTTRCLPWAYDRECLICEEHCPVSPKAIYFREVEVTKRDGTVVTLKRPYVDPDKCIGCGVCENKCVFKDRAAVRVASTNETRHSDNQPILPSGDSQEYGVPAPEVDETSTPESDPYGGGSSGSADPYA